MKEFILRSLIFIVISAFAVSTNLHAQPPQRGAGVVVKTAGGQMKEVKMYDGSYALVIGESDYSAGWDALPGVKIDVAEVSKSLNNQGFTVETSLSLPSEQLKARIDKFIGDYGYQKNNRLLIYFAGHGHTQKSNDGRDLGYIIPVDTPLPEKDDLGFRRKAISMDTIQNYARQIEAKHAIFIFDSCFSGRLISRDKITIPPVILEDVANPVRQFITAGAANQPVPDDSIFRKAFVRALGGEADRNQDGYITGSELADYLKEKVTNATDRAQTPQYGKIRDIELDQGDFVFILPRPATAADIPKPPSTKILDSLKLPEKPKADLNSQSIYDDLSLSKESTAGNKPAGEQSKLPSLGELSAQAVSKGYENVTAEKYQDALKNFDQAVSLNKNNSDAYQGRGTAHYFLKNNAQAMSDLNEAIRLNPKDWQAYTFRYLLNLRLGNSAAAEADRKMSVKLKEEKFGASPISSAPQTKPDPVLTANAGSSALAALNDLKFNWTVGSDVLKNDSQETIQKAVKLLKLMAPGTIVEIGGHTDNRGSETANQKLSEARAENIYNQLIAAGVSSSMLTRKGYGGTRPIYPNDTEEGRSKNRRIEFKVIN